MKKNKMTPETKPYLFVATPCFGGNVSASFTRSILGLQKLCLQNDIEISFCFIAGDSLITRARNLAVQQFLAFDGATHLLFIDADIEFPPEIVLTLLKGNKDVCGAIYPVKYLNWQKIEDHVRAGIDNIKASVLKYVVELFDTKIAKPDGAFFRARYLGTGFMLIRREVFPKMADHYPEIGFKRTNLQVTNDDNLKPSHAFFDCLIDQETGTYLSEDYTFCKRWVEMGGEIWAYVDSQLTHIGTLNFEGNFLAALTALGKMGIDFDRKA
jgi:hypothetical protein